MTDDVLRPASRRAIEHYRSMAETERVAAAEMRARAFHLPDDERLEVTRSADAKDLDAQRWEALAAELDAFAEQAASPDNGGTLL